MIQQLISGVYPKEIKSVYWRSIYSTTFITALLMVAKIWSQVKGPSKDGWLNKALYGYLVE